MSSRARRFALLGLGVVLLLFAGRWTAVLLADRWWAETISPAAAQFVVDWHLLNLTLETAGILCACTWFIGHLLLVNRAIGSVQVPRQVANLEIREALNARLLVVGSVVVGTVLGAIVGSGTGDWWDRLALAWTGVRYGETEPLLQQDIGVYVAQLPVWRLFHGYATLLVLLALGGTLTLYVVIGSVRWIDGRPALSDHARRHLGALLSGFAACLLWGYLLEPYERVAGVHGTLHDGLFGYHLVSARVLTVAAGAAAVLSAVWAWRPRHALVISGWALLATISLLGHHILPALLAEPGSPVDPAVRRRLEALAYGLTTLKDSTLRSADGVPGFTTPPALWPALLVPAMPAGDSGVVYSANRAVVSLGGKHRPVWVTARTAAPTGARVDFIADDQTSLFGEPLYYPEGDSIPEPVPGPRLHLSARAVWPGAPDYLIDSAATGVEARSALRRLILAWALQAGSLLKQLPSGSRVHWYLTPVARLSRVAPYARWSDPSARLIGGELVWLSDGYLSSATFPISSRVRWNRQMVGSVRASLVGVVTAETGEVHLYLRHTADPLAEAWSSMAGGMVQAASAIPGEVARAVGYPSEALDAQARVLEAPHWELGHIASRAGVEGGGSTVGETIWQADTSGSVLMIPFEQGPQARRVTALVQAGMVDGWESIRVLRFDSAYALPTPAILESKWNRFASFDLLRDSLAQAGGHLVRGPVKYWPAPLGLGAYQAQFDTSAARGPTLVWMSVALGERVGAGHTPAEAWQNLRGITAPLVNASSAATQLEEARRYLQQADSALRRGDFPGFGRAFEALKRLLQAPSSRPKS